jgi:DNA uptake protein ComE-like DNA-binding protein
VLVLGLLVRTFADGVLAGTAPPPFQASSHRVDLRTAGVAELQVLPGIGPTRATAIVLERLRRGPFDGPGALDRVDGIGPATAAELQPWLLPAPAAIGR